jgi:hypothetical protein
VSESEKYLAWEDCIAVLTLMIKSEGKIKISLWMLKERDAGEQKK